MPNPRQSSAPNPPGDPPGTLAPSDLPAPDWRWETEITFDGTAYQATYLPGPQRWPQIAFVRGLPPRFEDDLLLAAQDADTAPAWQVEARDGEPLELRLARARERLRHDLDSYRTDFVTVLGVAPGLPLELLGCAGARRRITAQHESEHWQVLARVLARPELRGQGLARRLAVPFMRTARALGGGAQLGFLNETQSLAVVMLLQLGQREGALDTLVGFGSRRRADAPDRTYLALYRGVRGWLLASGARARAEVSLSPELAEVVALCEAAWASGLDHDRLQRLAALAGAAGDELRGLAGQQQFFAVCADFIAAVRAWGLFDGTPVG
jgi:GNAT superfamily N-acetyltransferase